MSRYTFDVADADSDVLERWARQIASGKIDAVEVVDYDEVLAVLSKVQPPNSTTPAGWIVAGHAYDDDTLPAPFDSVGAQSNNVGASVWIHLSSGAMVAAIPDGPWNRPNQQFKFYYAPPRAAAPIQLDGWNGAQRAWNGRESCAPDIHHKHAIEFFNSVVGGTNTTYATASGPGVQ